MKIDIKEGIKMKVTPEQSKKVQEICFGLGIDWTYGLKGKVMLGVHYLYIYNESIQFTHTHADFEESMGKEVSAEEFIQTKGFTENVTENKTKESKKDKPKDNKKDVSKKILKKFIKRIKKEQKNKIYSEVTTYNKCADILKDIVLEVNKGKSKKKVKGD